MPSPPFGHRQRSRAAIILSRPDPLPAPAAQVAPVEPPAGRDWQWVWWIPLALLVAGAWGLLLFGDSLRAPPG
ncbi:hypothetical protein KF840_23120 [bacterium]|nr:hypothetical protein [bacterium]